MRAGVNDRIAKPGGARTHSEAKQFQSGLKALLLLFVIEIGLYALLLIVTPNGVAGSSWLGYYGLSKARHVLPADVLLRLGVWLLCKMGCELGIKHAKTWWMHREARG